MNPVHDWRNDIRLLVVLDVLLEEGNATRAAARLGVTQSSVSHSLRRLRTLLQDDLFVRSGRALAPTPRASALRRPLRELLEGLGALIVDGRQFEPRTSRRRFRIIASDLFTSSVLPKLMQRLSRGAPGITVAIIPPGPNVIASLEHEGIDVAFAYFPTVPRGVRKRELFEDDFTCLVRREHPRLRRSLDLDAYLDESHVLVTPTGRPGSALDDRIAALGRRRSVALTLPHFMAAGQVVAGSDLVTTLPTRVATPIARHFGLRRLPPPFPDLRLRIFAYWHNRVAHDAAVTWLLDTVGAAAAVRRR